MNIQPLAFAASMMLCAGLLAGCGETTTGEEPPVRNEPTVAPSSSSGSATPATEPAPAITPNDPEMSCSASVDGSGACVDWSGVESADE